MANFRVLHQGKEVGTSELEHHDPSMGIVRGTFRPSPAYQSRRGCAATPGTGS